MRNIVFLDYSLLTKSWRNHSALSIIEKKEHIKGHKIESFLMSSC